MDLVFKALADATRRELLDELRREDGQTLTALQERFPMTRIGVAKHLGILEEAGLVVTKRRGREKLHFLNPMPIRLVYDRWVTKYTEGWVAGLANLKHDLEHTLEHTLDHDPHDNNTKRETENTMERFTSSTSAPPRNDCGRRSPPRRSGPSTPSAR